MAACTWPATSNSSQLHKKAKFPNVTSQVSTQCLLTTFQRGIVSNIRPHDWKKAKIQGHTTLKTYLFKRLTHSINGAFWLVESRDAHRLLRVNFHVLPLIVHILCCYHVCSQLLTCMNDSEHLQWTLDGLFCTECPENSSAVPFAFAVTLKWLMYWLLEYCL